MNITDEEAAAAAKLASHLWNGPGDWTVESAVLEALRKLRTPPAQFSSTVLVRVAVAVGSDGVAIAAGGSGISEPSAERLLGEWCMLERWEADDKLRFCWVEADVPKPEPELEPTIVAE